MKKVIHYINPEGVTDRYDQCIGAALNGTVYALSWYLNITCPDWEFLCTEDFSTVMPLPVFRSMGKKILKQPDLTYQLGVFSTAVPDPELIQEFLQNIPHVYRFKKLCMNKFNLIQSSEIRQYSSCELDLIPSGKFLSGMQGVETRAALDRAREESLTYLGNISAHKFLEFTYQFDAFNTRRLKPDQVNILRLIASNALRYRMGQIAAAFDERNNLCASMFFLRFNGRASIHLLSASLEGIRCGALQFILDEYIRENSEQNLVLSVDNPDAGDMAGILCNFGGCLSQYPCLISL